MPELPVPNEPRECPRFRTHIPVVLEVAHAWESRQDRRVSGTLFNLSRGGCGVHAKWIVPPRTLLRVSVPAAPASIRLGAEVVWTSAHPGGATGSVVYGIRWTEFLSRRSFESILPDAVSGSD